MDISRFSNAQLAGQRLMVGFDGKAVNPDLQYLIRELKVGGIILFSRNIETPDQIRSLCAEAQAVARSCGQPPLFIAVDQEGGQVARLRASFTEFPGNPSMQGDRDARRFAEITAAELRDVGINMNMAPVLDVMPAGIDGIMRQRVFGHDPAWVTRLGVTVIRGFQENHTMAVAKHFPGIGRTILDSHLDLPTLDVTAAELEGFDLIPFAAALEQAVAGIMLSHILYHRLDPVWPASLSRAIAHDLLRQKMGYQGLVLTDDLDMGALSKHYHIRTIIERILTADVDIALICHQGPNIQIAFDEITKALARDRPRHIRGVERIMVLKEQYRL
jgi:beta-N-acetylhexosaminidase